MMPTKRKRNQLVKRVHGEEIKKCYEYACAATGGWPENEREWKKICTDHSDYFNDSSRKVDLHVCSQFNKNKSHNRIHTHSLDVVRHRNRRRRTGLDESETCDFKSDQCNGMISCVVGNKQGQVVRHSNTKYDVVQERQQWFAYHKVSHGKTDK